MADIKSFKEHIEAFLQEKSNAIVQNDKNGFDFIKKIYNEFSLQHELGNYLSNNGYEIFYEVNVKKILCLNLDYYTSNHACLGDCKNKNDWAKKEIDIVAIKRDNNGNIKEKYAIELKFPQNGRYPEEMFDFIKDICFMEQVKECWNNSKTFCITLTNDKNFYSDGKKISDEPYKYFRTEKSDSICHIENKEPIEYPTNKKDKQKPIQIIGKYNIEWHKLDDNIRYYCLEMNNGEI